MRISDLPDPTSPIAVEGEWVSLDQTGLDLLVREVTDSLASLGFYKQSGRTGQKHFFRDIFSRAGFSVREGKYMEDIFAKAARLRGLKAEGMMNLPAPRGEELNP